MLEIRSKFARNSLETRLKLARNTSVGDAKWKLSDIDRNVFLNPNQTSQPLSHLHKKNSRTKKINLKFSRSTKVSGMEKRIVTNVTKHEAEKKVKRSSLKWREMEINKINNNRGFFGSVEYHSECSGVGMNERALIKKKIQYFMLRVALLEYARNHPPSRVRFFFWGCRDWNTC